MSNYKEAERREHPNKRSISQHNRAGKYHWSNEARKRITGKNNPNWKGNNVTYMALHQWIRNHKPKPSSCEECMKRPPYDLANINGEYKRDINDFKWLCRSCHMKSDGRFDNLTLWGV